MSRTATVIATAAILLASGHAASAQVSLATAFRFDSVGADGLPVGWRAGPPGTVSVDSAVLRSGASAAVLKRTTLSSEEFSAFSMFLPIAFAGTTLELRGWLRMEDVTEFAGFWLREDTESGSVQFDNMEERQLTGTRDWAQYSIKLPLDPSARSIALGALIAGTGTLWIDELELLVDGKPVGLEWMVDAGKVVSQAPQRQP